MNSNFNKILLVMGGFVLAGAVYLFDIGKFPLGVVFVSLAVVGISLGWKEEVK